MNTLFISDLHLDPSSPEVLALFQQLLKKAATSVQSLYILGDLFEVWVGDDDPSEFNQQVMSCLKQLSQQGVKLYLMQGNRDFLIGHKFARRVGGTLLNDPVVIELGGKKTLITHGDRLCTDDKAYQRYRSIIQHPISRFMLRITPLSWRLKLANKLRQKSHQHQQSIEPTIMDINPIAMQRWLNKHGCLQVIHGHTHRPAIHLQTMDRQSYTRYVLSDWHHYGNALLVSANGEYRLLNFTSPQELLAWF